MNRDQNIMTQTPSEIYMLRKRGYYISQLLGQGAYSKVYRTDFNSNNNKFKLACKVIDLSIVSTNFLVKFLPQELNIISQLNHPHIIQIHSILQFKTKLYIFMRYAENGDLLDYILHYGPVKEKLAKIWLRQIVLAIQYLHMLEIVHRDIKCDNILITKHNNVKLTDFGFSRIIIDKNKKSILSETYCGSISYVAPQILLGEPYNAKAADMWSLGCVLYVMLNKAPPFDSTNLKTMLQNQLTKQIKFRAKYVARYDKSVLSLVGSLLEPNEYLRFRIEQVLTSYWLSNEPSLRLLNKNEFNALVNAMEIANCNGILTKESLHITAKINNSINYFKENNGGFELTLINSDINGQHRLAS